MIDVAIGLMLFFASISLVITAIQEWISGIFSLRSKNLKKGIEQLVGDEVATSIYRHPIMNTMKEKKGRVFKSPMPSYLKSNYFSHMLIDVISTDKSFSGDKMKKIEQSIGSIPDSNLKDVLRSFSARAEGKLEKFEELISEWFDAGMERASGWYKRSIQKYILGVSFLIVILINANALKVARVLWNDDFLRKQTVAVAEKLSTDDPSKTRDKNIRGAAYLYPIGWDAVCSTDGVDNSSCFPCNSNSPWTWWTYLESLIGWFITAISVSLGAPFWFDLLGKVSNMRQTARGKV